MAVPYAHCVFPQPFPTGTYHTCGEKSETYTDPLHTALPLWRGTFFPITGVPWNPMPMCCASWSPTTHHPSQLPMALEGCAVLPQTTCHSSTDSLYGLIPISGSWRRTCCSCSLGQTFFLPVLRSPHNLPHPSLLMDGVYLLHYPSYLITILYYLSQCVCSPSLPYYRLDSPSH